jgi:predicted nucleic acid-binding protein
MDSILRMYSRPLYPLLTIECTAYAAKLRKRYNLSFFDSIHTAVALKEDLKYYDLDPDVNRVIESERAIK